MSRVAKPAAARGTPEDDDGVDLDAVHRAHTSTATHGVSKPAGVPASAWEAGTLAKRAASKPRGPRVPFDPMAVVIEEGVPIPGRGLAVGSQYDELVESIKPGQSVVLAPTQARTFAKMMNKAGKRTAVRDRGDGTHRVWCVEAKPKGGAQ